ncbi:MAG: sigma-54 dependent transcriptional regulator [Bacteroidales bacterium]|jgi:DNA-binding NtrC family response regulator|nr:sigma-54 dependent transcriptional regulator [Bacteroidales bacterium]
MEKAGSRILIIDDDPVYRRLSSSILKERFTVFTAEAPSAGFETLKNEKIDYVICDYRLPQMDGLSVLERIKTDYPHVEVIMVSDAGNMDTVIEALRRGAVDYFKKPFTPADIWMSIEKTQRFSKLKKDFQSEKNKNSQLKQWVDKEMGLQMMGESPIIEEIKNQMRLVARTPDTSVLIIGESGTGKELVARGIHNMSVRRDELFGAVNMSAIPESLFESEFFGHKKGSFTGAIADKAGWFETTDKGSLFLDEIGDMPHNLQVKLLRVLEEKKYVKVGNQKEQTFDIRIIAATNKSLEEISNPKVFRTDLFHRIGTFIIHLPPLRERKEDIPVLVNYFVEQFSEKMAKTNIQVAPEVCDLLQTYNFPGNIRELRNLIERAVILCKDNVITADNFSIINKLAQSANHEDLSN